MRKLGALLTLLDARLVAVVALWEEGTLQVSRPPKGMSEANPLRELGRERSVKALEN